MSQQWRVYVMIGGKWTRIGKYDNEQAAYAALKPKPAGAVAWQIKRPGE